MTEERDNPLESILDEVILDSRKEGKTPSSDAELSPENETPQGSATGSTSRAYRFLADDSVIKDILQDMAKLSHEDLDKLDSARFGTGEYKSLDQVARETGIISFEQQEAVFRAYLERRVDELKDKLVGAQIGSYSIIDELGRGGMGIVFRARQESPMFTREVALKFMLAGPESQTHDRERFISEVKGLAGLSHPFLVPIFDSGIEGDLYYFSIEFIGGSPPSCSSVTARSNPSPYKRHPRPHTTPPNCTTNPPHTAPALCAPDYHANTAASAQKHRATKSPSAQTPTATTPTHPVADATARSRAEANPAA